MTELTAFIREHAPAEADMQDISAFFIDNNWFGMPPQIINGKVMITDEQAAAFKEPLLEFAKQKSCMLFASYKKRFPVSASMFHTFAKEESLSDDTQFYIVDFLLYWQEKDLPLYDDYSMGVLMKRASEELPKAHGEIFTFFAAWLRTKTKTAYHRDYIMEQRYTMDIQNEAYDFDEYLQLLYYLFNPDYIEDNHMYEKAADSMNYTDTWLYLSMHYLCSLRSTDLARIHHPDLPCDPETVIRKIRQDTFTENEARLIILSINTRMCILPFTPNKTSGKTGVGSVKFSIPNSCEVHIGKLFALAESHRQLAGKAEMPIIRKISTYREISRYMGDEIGSLFLESDFRSRSATKSYLQAIDMLTDDILDNTEDGMHVKGYMLAALARSHKGSYGEFASTTFEYLKDAKLSGLTPEFVAFELFERGVLSFIPSMLLKMTTEGSYDRLNVKNQTKLLQSLDMSPREVEAVITVLDKGKKEANSIAANIFTSGADVLSILHRIGCGQAFSKEAECLCLCSAINKVCPYPDRRQCVGCRYEISTKSTFYLMISEYNRNVNLYRTVTDPREKNKYRQMLENIILPKMNEMLCCIKDEYGKEIFQQYEQMIKENT